jgi:hypothetical protein
VLCSKLTEAGFSGTNPISRSNTFVSEQ